MGIWLPGACPTWLALAFARLFGGARLAGHADDGAGDAGLVGVRAGWRGFSTVLVAVGTAARDRSEAARVGSAVIWVRAAAS